MTKAVLIKTTGEVENIDLEENSYQQLNTLCGGWIDSVSNTDGDIVGYVNDEGLLIGLAPNVIATLLFGRPLVGDCVIVGALDKDGNYDGDNHDVPEKYLGEEFLEFAEVVRNHPSITETLASIIQEMDLMPVVLPLTDDMFATEEGK